MLANNVKLCNDFVQVINNLINDLLINNAVKKIQTESLMTTYNIYTEIK